MSPPNVIFPGQINSCHSILFISFHLNAMIHAVPSACKDVTHLISFRFGFLAILVGNMNIIYRELGLNRVFARLQVEEIWNCCRIRPPDRSHGLMVIVVSSEGRHHLNIKWKYCHFSKSNPLAQEGLSCPIWLDLFLDFQTTTILSGFISVVTRVHTEPSPASLTGPGSVSCVCSGYWLITQVGTLEDEIV